MGKNKLVESSLDTVFNLPVRLDNVGPNKLGKVVSLCWDFHREYKGFLNKKNDGDLGFVLYTVMIDNEIWALVPNTDIKFRVSDYDLQVCVYNPK